MRVSLRRFTTLFAALFATAGALASVSEKFSRTYPLAADGVVSLENINGQIEIVAWDKNEVSVEAEKIASSQESLERISIDIDSAPGHLAIKTNYEKKWKLFTNIKLEVRYKLHVPAGASLRKIHVVNSDITIHGVRGDVDLETVNGSIEAAQLSGEGRFHTVNGSVRAAFDKLPSSGSISLHTVNGSCTVVLPADAAFDLDTRSVNGNTTTDFPMTIAKSGRKSLAGSVNGGGIEVKLRSVNGSLKVRAAK